MVQTDEKLSINLAYDSVITFLGISPKKLKTYIHTKTGAQTFTVALLITARTWKEDTYLLEVNG
jgi:hypothetical protein